MKVATLIAELMKHDPDADVTVEIAMLWDDGTHRGSYIADDVAEVTHNVTLGRVLVVATAPSELAEDVWS